MSISGELEYEVHTIDPYTGDSTSTSFWITVLGCIYGDGWSGVPSDGSVYNTEYVIGSGKLNVDFEPIHLNYCRFGVDVYDTTIGNSLPSNIFDDDHPNFSKADDADGYSAKCHDLDSWAQLEVDTYDFSEYGNVYTVLAVLDKYASSVPVNSISFTFTVTLGFGNCVTNPTPPTIPTSVTYFLGSTIWDYSFTDESNGDCPFTTSLFELGSGLDADSLPQFSFTGVQFDSTNPASSTGSYSPATQSNLVINTSDATLIGTYSMQYQMFDIITGAMITTVDFDVVIKYNDCPCGFTGVPVDTSTTYEIGTSKIQFELSGIANTQCPFEFSIHETSYPNAVSLNSPITLMSQAEQDYIFDINDPCNIQYTADGNY